mmetsp:Transcript_12026/g.36662  ORF Transcript_12026/g.36662 Transcript_12026/m.36662 type:complete len:293 (+) Transcript_12026:207-1085(+)
MDVCVLELGAWRTRRGRAGEADPTLRASDGVRGDDGNWRPDGVAESLRGETALLLVEPSLWLKDSVRAEILSQCMEGQDDIKQVYFLRGAAAASYAIGRVTAMVVDVGETATVVTPVSDGYFNRNAVRSSHFAGRGVSELVAKLLPEGADVHAAKSALLAPDAAEPYVLPDGSRVERSAEGLTGAARRLCDAVGDLPRQAVAALDAEPRRALSSADTVLCGGSSLVRGVEEHVRGLNVGRNAMTIASQREDRIVQAWRGGSILGSLSTYGQIAITKEEFDERGQYAVLSKCP